MKLSIKRENFIQAIQKVINIIGNRSTLPVLANILLEAKDNTLTLTTSPVLRLIAAIEILTLAVSAWRLISSSTPPAKTEDIGTKNNIATNLKNFIGLFRINNFPGG